MPSVLVYILYYTIRLCASFVDVLIKTGGGVTAREDRVCARVEIVENNKQRHPGPRPTLIRS